MERVLHSSGYSLIVNISLIGMGDIITNEVIEWFSRRPKVIKVAIIIARLMVDFIFISHKVYMVYYSWKAAQTKLNFLK